MVGVLCCVFANPLNLYIYFSISARGLSTFISYFKKICHFNNTHNPRNLNQTWKSLRLLLSLSLFMYLVYHFFMLLSADEKVLSFIKSKETEKTMQWHTKGKSHKDTILGKLQNIKNL